MLDEIFGSLGLVGAIAILVVNLLVNTGVLWFLVNYIFTQETPVPLKKCFIAVVYLSIWSVISVLILLLPIPFVVLVWLGVWLFGSKAILEGTLELMGGGLFLVIIYGAVIIGLQFLTTSLM